MSLVLGGIAIVLVPLLMLLSWKMYIKYQGVVGEFSPSDIVISEIFSGENEIAHTFMSAVWNRSLTTSSVFPICYVAAVIISLLLLSVLGVLVRKNNTHKKYIISGVSLLIGACGYAFTMMCLYAFCFAEFEAAFLSSFDRYMSTFVITILMVTMVFAIADIKKDFVVNLAFVVLIAMVFLISDNRLYVIPAVKPGMSYYEKLAVKIESTEGEVEVSPDDYVAMKYYFSPREIGKKAD